MQLHVSFHWKNLKMIDEFSISTIFECTSWSITVDSFVVSTACAGLLEKNRNPFQVFHMHFLETIKYSPIHQPFLCVYFTLFGFIVDVCDSFSSAPSMLCWNLLFRLNWMDSILFSLRKVTRLSLLLFIIMESSLFLLKERKTQPFNANPNTQWCTMNRPTRVSWIFDLTKNKFWFHLKLLKTGDKWYVVKTDENIEHMFVHKGVHFGRPKYFSVCPIYSSRSFNKKTINVHAVMKRISAVAPVDRLKTRLLCSARLRCCVGKFVIFFMINSCFFKHLDEYYWW